MKRVKLRLVVILIMWTVAKRMRVQPVERRQRIRTMMVAMLGVVKF